ncbi:hypothetical protein LVJ94_17210 [Pendulispora rubella]|uniref:Uncharacterized protein n=1 Tax=Pendulispora rubella TaxID=2741070 RepID=A0ABZ2LDF1_9BACT
MRTELPSSPYRVRAAILLDRLTSLLVFGAPPPPDPRAIELQNLGTEATRLRDTLRSTP